VVSFDAATGAPGPVLEISSGGSGVLRFLPEAVPRQDTVVLWTPRIRGPAGHHGWQLLTVRSDRIDVLMDHRWEGLPPDSAAWDGQQVLLAPWGRPRSEDQPADWEEPFASYMKLLGGASR
jgi:hypothetical protein